MFSYPEEDRMEKMTPSAIRGRESERHTEKKKDGEKGESFSAGYCCLPQDGRFTSSKSMWVYKRIQEWKHLINFINVVNKVLHCRRKWKSNIKFYASTQNVTLLCF